MEREVFDYLLKKAHEAAGGCFIVGLGVDTDGTLTIYYDQGLNGETDPEEIERNYPGWRWDESMRSAIRKEVKFHMNDYPVAAAAAFEDNTPPSVETR